MNEELMANREYQLAHIMNTRFDHRMYDMYIGLASSNRPPFLEDFLIESTKVQALITLEGMSDHDLAVMPGIQEAVWNDEEDAKIQVLESGFSRGYEQVFDETLYYLDRNHLSVLTRQGAGRRRAKVINAPVLQIW